MNNSSEIKDHMHPNPYEFSLIMHKMGCQKGKPYALFTDVDYTWLRLVKKITLSMEEFSMMSEVDLEKRLEKRGMMNRFYAEVTRSNKEFLDSRGVPIVGVSGRDYASFQKLLNELGESAGFDIFIGSQGGEIYVRQLDGSYIIDSEYLALVKRFDKAQIYLACDELTSENSLVGRLSFMSRDSHENIVLYEQNSNAQDEGLTENDPPPLDRVLCYFEGNMEEAEEVTQQLENRLIDRKFSQFRIVLAGTNGRTDHWDIEIVSMDKRDAVKYLVQKLNCDGIVAGNAGNDLEMLKHAASAGIVVGGAESYLIERISNFAGSAPDSLRVFARISQDSASERIIHFAPDKGDKHQGPASVDIKKLYHAFMLLRSLSKF